MKKIYHPKAFKCPGGWIGVIVEESYDERMYLGSKDIWACTHIHFNELKPFVYEPVEEAGEYSFRVKTQISADQCARNEFEKRGLKYEEYDVSKYLL